MPLDPSLQIALDYKSWLASITKPRFITSDHHEQTTKSESKVIYDFDEEM